MCTSKFSRMAEGEDEEIIHRKLVSFFLCEVNVRNWETKRNEEKFKLMTRTINIRRAFEKVYIYFFLFSFFIYVCSLVVLFIFIQSPSDICSYRELCEKFMQIGIVCMQRILGILLTAQQPSSSSSIHLFTSKVIWYSLLIFIPHSYILQVSILDRLPRSNHPLLAPHLLSTPAAATKHINKHRSIPICKLNKLF